MIDLDPRLRAQAQRRHDALVADADYYEAQALALRARAAALAKTWQFGVECNCGQPLLPESDAHVSDCPADDAPWCTCGAKTPQAEYHDVDCPAFTR